MKRQYLTYTRIPIFDGKDQVIRQRIDPQSTVNERWGVVFTFRETWANGSSVNDPRIIAVIEHDDKDSQIQDMINKDGLFEFELITEEKVIEKMNLWYGEGNWDFDDNNIFADLRPKDMEMI